LIKIFKNNFIIFISMIKLRDILKEGSSDGGKMAKTHVVYAMNVELNDKGPLGDNEVETGFRVSVKKGPDAEDRAKKLAKTHFGKNFKSIISISKALNPEKNKISESITSHSFPKFKKYLESIIPKNKNIQFFIDGHRLLIGYFPDGSPMSTLSKSLPNSTNDRLEKLFTGKPFTVMTKFTKPDPRTGKTMVFTAISADSQNDLKSIEDIV